MAALAPDYMVILKKILRERFVDALPPLLDTKKPAVEQQDKQLSRAFSAFVLHKLLDLAPAAATASVVDDFNDKGIDAVHYHEPSQTLYLLQTKLKESEQFKQEDALPFCEGVRLLLKQEFTAFNQHVLKRQAEIETALDVCSHIELVVPFTGDGVSKTASDALQALLDDEDLDDARLVRQVHYYAADEIARDLRAEQAYSPVHTDVYLQRCSSVQEPRATYYGLAKLSDLVALHQQHGKALYERNIRYYLGSSKSEVSAAIQTTLRDAPDEFFYLNNGVTAVCDHVDQKGNKPATGFRRYQVRGLSIINGAQTVASAAEFVALNPQSNIECAKVLFTLIKAPAAGDFGKQVTKARNHQNPVQMANFAALDENQERLRQEAGLLGFDYLYRPEAQGTSPMAFTLEEALRALALQQNDPRYPVWLKGELTRLSNPESDEYKALFSSTLRGMSLVNAVQCQRVLRDLIVSYENGAPSASREKMLYRHGNYAIISVMMKRLRNRIVSTQILIPSEVAALISPSLDLLRQQAFDLGQLRLNGAGPLAFFRNQGNVVAFLADLMEEHYRLATDPAIAPLRNIQNAADAYPRKRLIDYMSSKAPQI